MKKRKSTHESGMAGEFYVMEALYRLGYQPALTMGNAKKIDILCAVSQHRTIRISVKAARGGGKWPIGKTDWKKHKDLYFAFLHYSKFNDVTTKPNVYIIPSRYIDNIKERWFDSYAIYFSNPERRQIIDKYKDAWPLLKKK